MASTGRASRDAAVQLLRSAADLDDASEKHPVTPGALLPAREQLAELLLELGRPVEALSEYEASLKRAPGRLLGVHGAARAAALSGDKTKARSYYEQLISMTTGSDGIRPEIREAQRNAAAFVTR